jgi:hypothetical protein
MPHQLHEWIDGASTSDCGTVVVIPLLLLRVTHSRLIVPSARVCSRGFPPSFCTAFLNSRGVNGRTGMAARTRVEGDMRGEDMVRTW